MYFTAGKVCTSILQLAAGEKGNDFGELYGMLTGLISEENQDDSKNAKKHRNTRKIDF